MTSVILCVMDGGRIRPIDQDKLAKWKKAHKQGQAFEMILDDGESSALSAKAKKYFALRDEYADLGNHSIKHAHIELKHLHGFTRPVGLEPEGRLGRKVRYFDEEEWQLSIADYSEDELKRLLRGVQATLDEATV